VRGSDRRTAPRGTDRRKSAASKKKAARRRAQAPSASRVQELSVTVSIGVASPETQNADVASVLKLADQALYRAKEGGRNRVEVATAEGAKPKKKAARLST